MFFDSVTSSWLYDMIFINKRDFRGIYMEILRWESTPVGHWQYTYMFSSFLFSGEVVMEEPTANPSTIRGIGAAFTRWQPVLCTVHQPCCSYAGSTRFGASPPQTGASIWCCINEQLSERPPSTRPSLQATTRASAVSAKNAPTFKTPSGRCKTICGHSKPLEWSPSLPGTVWRGQAFSAYHGPLPTWPTSNATSSTWTIPASVHTTTW